MSREKDELRKRLRDGCVAGDFVYLPVGIQNDCQSPGDKPRIQPDILATLAAASTVFGYLAIPPEPEVLPLMKAALAAGAKVLVPRVVGNDLEFAPLASTAGPFSTGPYGIREPLPGVRTAWPGRSLETPAVILVPALAFSKDGARLGRGKGYYDRFLASLLKEAGSRRNGITIVGICRPERVLEHVPTEPHDIPVDCLWTEKDGIFTVY